MDKILTFIVNKNNELLLLKGNENDSQFKESFWYVVTGGCENTDLSKEMTVQREIKEETGLQVESIKYLNWIFKYYSLGKKCIEYVYFSRVKNGKVVLNEESIDYKWCNLDEFVNEIKWYTDKTELKEVLKYALREECYFKEENSVEIID